MSKIIYVEGLSKSDTPELNNLPYCTGILESPNVKFDMVIRTRPHDINGIKPLYISMEHLPTKTFACFKSEYCNNFEDGKQIFEKIITDFKNLFI